MSNFAIKCCVCLNSIEVATSNVHDLKNELITKLRNVVPEVEWLEEYEVCQTCSTQLNVAYEFRNTCLRLDCERITTLQLPKVTEIFTCYHCNVNFTDKETLTDHIHSHQPEKKPELDSPIKFPCGNCDKTYSSKKVLRAHLKKCNPNEIKKTRNFSCEICNLVLPQAKRIIEHCIDEHSMDRKLVKPYSCTQCPMRFSSSANIIQHRKYHEGNRSHVCSICGKTYITKSDLTVHEYTHFNRRNYKCEFCTKAFNTNKNLRSHILVVHTDSSLWKYGCDLCSRRFPLKSGYEQHMKRHAGDKKFVCHICEKSFVSRSELQKHLRYHSMAMARPFKCDHCDKAYKNKRLHEIHLTKSHGIGNAKIPIKEKKFVCHVCPNTFFDKQKLERHLQAHSGIKPFMCLQCDKKFSDKYYLKQHLKNLHNLCDEELDCKLKMVL